MYDCTSGIGGETYAASRKIRDLSEVLGESKAGEERGGENEALHSDLLL